MPTWLQLFHTAGFAPHASCITDKNIIAQHITGDLMIALAYFVIPVLLFRLARGAQFAFSFLFFWFALFITLCGLTHVMAVVVLYYPLYVLEGWIKLLTGIVSLIVLGKLLALLAFVRPIDFHNIMLLREVTLVKAAIREHNIGKAVKLRKLIMDLSDYADKIDMEIG